VGEPKVRVMRFQLDRAQQSREQHFRVQHLDMRLAFAHGRGDGGCKSESGNEIPKDGGGPSNGAKWFSLRKIWCVMSSLLCSML